MRKLKICITVMFMLIANIHANSQTFQLKDLVGKPWRGVSGYMGCGVVDITFQFTEDSLKFKAWAKDNLTDVVSFGCRMCMSDSILTTDSLDGVYRQDFGKYINIEDLYTEKGEKVNSLMIFKIILLSDNKLILKSENKPQFKIKDYEVIYFER